MVEVWPDRLVQPGRTREDLQREGEVVDTVEGLLGEWLADRIPKLASKNHHRFPAVPTDDFEQEMWLRATKHKAKLAQYLRQGNDAYIWRELNAAATKLGKQDDRYRRAIKAAAAGYRTIDDQFYSPKVIVAALGVLIRAEFDVSVAVNQVARADSAGQFFVRGNDPERNGDYMVVLMDVCQAFDRLKPYDQGMLKAYYDIPPEDTDENRWERRKLASSMGMTYEAFKQKAYRAVRKLQRELGGEDPWRRQDREAA